MKAIVNVILDRVIDQEALIEKAAAISEATKRRLQEAARRIGAMSGGNQQGLKLAWRKAFIRLMLAEEARHAAAAMNLAHRSLKAEIVAVRRVGIDALRQIPRQTKVEISARLAERNGLGSAHAA